MASLNHYTLVRILPNPPCPPFFTMMVMPSTIKTDTNRPDTSHMREAVILQQDHII